MVHFHQRFLVAVAMEQDSHRALGWRIVWRVSLQKLAEQKCLASEPVGALVGGKQVMQLIPKHRSATRHKKKNGRPCVTRVPKTSQKRAKFFLASPRKPEKKGGPPKQRGTRAKN